jgi:hypothetical protein
VNTVKKEEETRTQKETGVTLKRGDGAEGWWQDRGIPRSWPVLMEDDDDISVE